MKLKDERIMVKLDKYGNPVFYNDIVKKINEINQKNKSFKLNGAFAKIILNDDFKDDKDDNS